MTDTIETADKVARALYSQPDIIDLRDRYYEPALVPLPQQHLPAVGSLNIRDQGETSACTGFALASIIDAQSGRPPVSPRMLFAMARLHDDLPDADNAGSTLRGALKGFYNNGVCSEEEAKFDKVSPDFTLTQKRAFEARAVSLGAYFRLNHEINDYHTAIIEAGAVIASAKIHTGWAKPARGDIPLKDSIRGRHAFAIVGYDQDGFLVQNSWGERWSTLSGLKGVARWSYEDWAENVEDAWVLRLAISSPRAFSVKYARAHKDLRDRKNAASAAPLKPRRQDILGHYLHVDDGKLVAEGRFAQQERDKDGVKSGDISAMTDRIAAMAEADQIQHLLFVAHGALQKRSAIAARAKAWLPVFLKNGIYPVHMMWETGFNNEVVDVMRDLLFKTKKRAGTQDKHLDERLEALARPLGRKLWRDLKTTASLCLERGTEGGDAAARIMAAAPGLKLHFAAQSAGALLFGEALKLAAGERRRFETGILMAPACSIDFYDTRIRPHFGRQLGRLVQYSLIEKRELEDKLEVYGKSLLYLVSHAIEAECGTPILGLERDLNGTERHPAPKLDPAHEVFFSGRKPFRTDADTHRGFDSDRKTMNDMLEQITGAAVPRASAFQPADLSGY